MKSRIMWLAALCLYLNLSSAQASFLNLPFSPNMQFQLLYPDLTAVMVTGSIKDNHLIFQGEFEPGQSVRLLVSDKTTGHLSLTNAVTVLNGDVLLEPNSPKPLKLSTWLAMYDVDLVFE
ncbi:MAG: hypothetical protein R2880_21045 [Deinococcales bacterium]